MTEVSQDMQTFFDKMPGVWGCKDERSMFCYANAEFARINGVAHHLDLIGTTSADLPNEVAACAELFHEQERAVMEHRKSFRMLDIHPWVGGWGVRVVTKTPWLDGQQQVVGTIFHGVDITDAYSMNLSAQLARWSGAGQQSFVLQGADGAGPKLTARESEVLFLIMRGKTAKLAAASLGLSPRTVQQHIDMLKAKFNAANKSELIDAAMASGYLNRIPLSLFTKQLSVVLSND